MELRGRSFRKFTNSVLWLDTTSNRQHMSWPSCRNILGHLICGPSSIKQDYPGDTILTTPSVHPVGTLTRLVSLTCNTKQKSGVFQLDECSACYQRSLSKVQYNVIEIIPNVHNRKHVTLPFEEVSFEGLETVIIVNPYLLINNDRYDRTCDIV